MPSSSIATFSLKVSLGYGSDHSVEETLNRACKISPPSSGSIVESLTSTFFGSTSTSGNTTGGVGGSKKDDKESTPRFFVASASQVELSMDNSSNVQWLKSQSTSLAAVLLPPSIIDQGLEKYTSTAALHASGSCFWIQDSSANELQKDLLSSIHSSLHSCRIIGIVRTSIASEDNAPAEWLLFEAPRDSNLAVDELVKETTGSSLQIDSTLVLKMLPISSVQFSASVARADEQRTSRESLRTAPSDQNAAARDRILNTDLASTSTSSRRKPPDRTFSGGSLRKVPSIPTCAVCLHRLDPLRLGLPTPSNDNLCSKFCPPPNLLSWLATPEIKQSCPQQKFLIPWKGARCKACSVISNFWDPNNESGGANQSLSSGGHLEPPYSSVGADGESHTTLYCNECSMHKTLWVCLTCGYVGCGRYSNKHSVQHFQETGHPYSLELATLRIWDYVHEDRFAHRVDLLECPCSPPLAHPWMARGSSFASSRPGMASQHSGDGLPQYEKTPKKATLIGQEYEALLQSALEDQALHYEGEITRLRAELASASIDPSLINPQDRLAIETLESEITDLKKEIEQASRSLLETQSLEAQHRATSQRLLHEQQEADALIKRIEQEAREEAQQGKLQVEDLEQQVQDLTTNLQMSRQFSQSEELSNAQIFGTTEVQSSNRRSSKRGKKKGRFFRK